MKFSEILTESIASKQKKLEEKWSEKYKRSIDCSHPKGFSQRAHCQGRKKNESIEKLDEIDRRGFLRGVGAAAGMAATGAMAAPFTHKFRRDHVEQTSNISEIFSRDKSAKLVIHWDIGVRTPENNRAYIVTTDGSKFSITPESDSPLIKRQFVKYRFDNYPIIETFLPVMQRIGNTGLLLALNKSGWMADNSDNPYENNGWMRFVKLLMEHDGIFRILVDIEGKGKKLLTFDIEQDQITNDFNAMIGNVKKPTQESYENLDEDSMSLRDWFGKGKHGGAGGGGWDRYNSKGERIGKCGDSKPGEGKPKCLSKAKAASLRSSGGKKAIAAAVNKKRRKDPNKERSGKAKMVSNKTKKS